MKDMLYRQVACLHRAFCIFCVVVFVSVVAEGDRDTFGTSSGSEPTFSLRAMTSENPGQLVLSCPGSARGKYCLTQSTDLRASFSEIACSGKNCYAPETLSWTIDSQAGRQLFY